MIDFDKHKVKPTRVYINEDVNFDDNGHAKLSKISNGQVYVITETGHPVKVHSSANVIYYKKFSNMKNVQVTYSTIENCRVIEINSEDYTEGFTIELK